MLPEKNTFTLSLAFCAFLFLVRNRHMADGQTDERAKRVMRPRERLHNNLPLGSSVVVTPWYHCTTMTMNAITRSSDAD